MKIDKIKNTDELLYTKTLDNGLKIFIIPNNNIKKFYITLTTKFGGKHNKYIKEGKKVNLPKGTAHFLEHLMFDMPNDENIFAKLEELGLKTNAYTSLEKTTYEVYGSKEIKKGLKHLLNYVYTPYFTDKLFKEEKGIINEEIKASENNIYRKEIKAIFDNIYVNDPIKNEIAGTLKDIKELKLSHIKEAYETFYHPENMHLNITGNVNPKEIVKYINEEMKNYTFKKYIKPEIITEKEADKLNKTYNEIKEETTIPKVSVSIKIPKTKLPEKCSTTIKYINNILSVNFGSLSLLREKLYHDKIINNNLETIVTAGEAHYSITISGESYKEEKLIKEILKELNHLTFNKKLFDIKTKKKISTYITWFDNIFFINNLISSFYLNEGEYNLNKYDEYANPDYKYVKEIIKLIKESEKSILKVMPKE